MNRDSAGRMRRHGVTREVLLDGRFLADVRRTLGPAARTDEELEASLAATLAGDDVATGDVWLFGYGSLMWNPVIRYAERRVALVRGWHRRYCLWVRAGRGSPECPGLMLGLDRGGSCRGVAFRIPAAQVRAELGLTWRREMLSGAYAARWVSVELDKSGSGDSRAGPDRRCRAVTFVVNRGHERYVRGLSEDSIAERIASASGRLGTCAEYLEDTVVHLRELGLRDAGLERLRARIAARRTEPRQG